MKRKQRQIASDQVVGRYSKLIVLFALLAVVIFVRAAFLMFGETHAYWMEVSKQFKMNNIEIPAKRGNILAADGKVLATTLPEYKLYMDFMSWEGDSVMRIKDQLLRDRMLYLKLDSVAQGMHEIFPDIDPDVFKQHLLRGRAAKSHHWLLYNKQVTYVDYMRAKSLPLFCLSRLHGGGFDCEEFLKRKNPYGLLAHATVGVYDEERDSLRTGLEDKFDAYLRGKPGRGHKEKVMSRYVPIIDSVAVDGYDVVTTLDIVMQDLVEKTLRDQLTALTADIGMCILMDVKTGDIKAMSSLSRCSDGKYRERENRAATSRREPGSVFKPMSFMVALEDGVINMNSSVYVGNGIHEFYGKKMRDSNWARGGSHRALSVPEIIKASSNVGVSVLINQHYSQNPKKFVDGLDRIGVRTDFHLPIQGYKAPNIRYPDKDHWSATTLPWMSVGYETQIPPIQTLAFYNGVANGGKMVKPRLISAIKSGDEIIEDFPVEYVIPDNRGNMMCSERTLQNIKTCLEGVVGRANCTGKDVYTKRFPIAGKTGTAQIWEGGHFTGKYIVSFAGYFPADNPMYSMIVCLERRGPASGGGMCGPVFKRIAESIWARDIHADIATTRDSTEHRNDLPIMRGGNLNALSSVLDELGVGYNRAFPQTDGLVWGSNTSSTFTSATLSSDGANMTKRDKNLKMPNIEGYGLRDAIYRLERMGLKVKPQGRGRVVRQSVAPGQSVKRGQCVEIVLSTAEKYKDEPAKPDSTRKAPPKPDAALTRDTASAFEYIRD